MGKGLPVQLWDELSPDDQGEVRWIRAVPRGPVAVLLGAFDPPTNAHVAIARTAAAKVEAPPALCLTKVLLARPPDELLPAPKRLELLDEIASAEGFGLCIANRGTYLEVGRVLDASGYEPFFVIGSDKLGQLADPSFYADGDAGVAATFDDLRFVVVPRADDEAIPPDNAVVLQPDEVFGDTVPASLSATEVRRRIRAGESVETLVPPGVARALGGYTAAR